MITTINNKHKELNFSSEREQSQACLNSAEHEKNQGRKVLNVPNLRFPEFQGEWKVESIKDVADFMGGGTPSSSNESFWQGTIPWVSSSDIVENDIKNISISRYITEEAIAHSATKLCPAPSILIVSRVGVGKIALSKEAICTSQDFCNLINIKVEPIFLTYCLSQIMKRKSMEVQGTSIKGITTSEIQKISINIPSLREQKKIGKILSLLDERIATQNKIIEDLKKLKSAISKKLLCNDKWSTCIIQDIAEIGRGRVISSVEIERQKHPLYPVYSSQTSNDGIMGYLDDYMFDGEYITWTTDGANAGTVFYRKGKFNCTNVCGTLKILPKFDCYFVSLVLQQATQKYVSSNLANPKLMNNTMASIKIRMPNIETQKQLSKVFQTLDSCLLVHQRTCKMYLSEKQYLLRQMFI